MLTAENFSENYRKVRKIDVENNNYFEVYTKMAKLCFVRKVSGIYFFITKKNRFL